MSETDTQTHTHARTHTHAQRERFIELHSNFSRRSFSRRLTVSIAYRPLQWSVNAIDPLYVCVFVQ